MIRAVAAFAIWQLLPEDCFTRLPAAVAGIYLVTVISLFIDSGPVARKLKSTGS